MNAAVQIIIEGLPLWFSRDDIEALCRPFGTVRSAKVARDRSEPSLQMGFVKFEMMEQAQRFRDAIHGIRLAEQFLTVTIIQEKTDPPS
jgi:RNA recognition motif-containing protein